MIEGDAQYTIMVIAHYVGITWAAAYNILTEHLGRRKLCARWVPHLLTNEQKAYCVKFTRE